MGETVETHSEPYSISWCGGLDAWLVVPVPFPVSLNLDGAIPLIENDGWVCSNANDKGLRCFFTSATSDLLLYTAGQLLIKASTAEKNAKVKVGDLTQEYTRGIAQKLVRSWIPSAKTFPSPATPKKMSS